MSNINLSLSARDDGTLEAAYIRLSNAKAAETRELIRSVLLIDMDDEGNLVGVEILAPVKISEVRKLADNLEGRERNAFRAFVQNCTPKSLVTCD